MAALPAPAVIRDGGIDPANLGKGDWIYSMRDATNRIGGHIAAVTNEASLMLYYKSIGVRYMIVKAATSDALYNGCYAGPQFTRLPPLEKSGSGVFGVNKSPTATTFKLGKYTTESPLVWAAPKCMS